MTAIKYKKKHARKIDRGKWRERKRLRERQREKVFYDEKSLKIEMKCPRIIYRCIF